MLKGDCPREKTILQMFFITICLQPLLHHAQCIGPSESTKRNRNTIAKNLYPISENSACANVTVFPIPLILAVDRVSRTEIIISLVCQAILAS